MCDQKQLTALFHDRDHPASEVYVTGTFDDWAKSVKLEKKGDFFEKLVELPQAAEKIYYKVCISNSVSLNTATPRPFGRLRKFLKCTIVTPSRAAFLCVG